MPDNKLHHRSPPSDRGSCLTTCGRPGTLRVQPDAEDYKMKQVVGLIENCFPHTFFVSSHWESWILVSSQFIYNTIPINISAILYLWLGGQNSIDFYHFQIVWLTSMVRICHLLRKLWFHLVCFIETYFDIKIISWHIILYFISVRVMLLIC